MDKQPKIDWTKWDSREITFKSTRGECRNCTHGEFWHVKNGPSCNYNNWDEAKCVPPGYMSDILVPRVQSIGLCPCLRYIPGNNLDYLEWCEQRTKL